MTLTQWRACCADVDVLSSPRPPTLQVFDQALAGGGAKGINFQDLAADLAQITFDYPFRIPPYVSARWRRVGWCFLCCFGGLS